MKKITGIFSSIVALFRIARLLTHFTTGLAVLLFNRIRWGKDWYYTDKGAEVVRAWMEKSCKILGVKVHVSGVACSDPVVLVSNHVSWIDIAAIASVTPVTFVAKTDLESWPMVGALSKLSGTVFIKRGSLRAVHKILSKLSGIIGAGRKIVFFPEGTTTSGESVNKFHSALFDVAYKANCPVQPVALSYFRNAEPDREIAPYIDDDHFVKHLWTLLVKGKVNLQLDFLDELETSNYSRQRMAQVCQRRIKEVIQTTVSINEDYPLEVQEAGYISVS